MSEESPRGPVERIVRRLSDMADKHSHYDIGDYWNAVDDAAFVISALHAAAEEARRALSVLIATDDRMVFSKALRMLDEVLGEPPNAEVSGAGTASAGLPGCASNGSTE